MWDNVNQLLGICGFVEAIVGFIFIELTNEDSLPEFLYEFFHTTSLMDVMAGALFSLFGFLLSDYLPPEEGGSSLKRLMLLFMHPAHVLTQSKINGDDSGRVVYYHARISFFCWRFTTVLWASFYPVWDSRFTGDEGLWIALSTISLVLVLLFMFKVHGINGLCGIVFMPNVLYSTLFKWGFSLLFLMYAMDKAFELFILLSNGERLIGGIIGVSLVGLQATIIFSVAFLLFHLWVRENGENSNINVEEQDGPRRDVDRQRTMSTELESGDEEL